ncbi:MAG: DUF2513 domain-containing protein [Panacagrimonas sp.]
MTRNWDVMRLILVTMEEQAAGEFQLYPRDFAPVDPETVVYHLRLLRKGGYIEGADRNMPGVPAGEGFIAMNLTLQGHDLADTLKSKTVWARIQSTARLKGIELTFDTVKVLAAHAVQSLL